MVTYVDIIILITVILFIVLGFRDGFFRKVFSLISLIVGFLLATKLMTLVGKLIIDWFDFSPLYSYLFAFFGIFFAVTIILALLYRWLGTKSSVLKLINRFTGALLGGLQGILIASLVLLVLKFADVPSEEIRNDSLLYEDIVNVAPKVFDFILSSIPESKSFFEEVGKHIEKYKETF